MILSDLAKFQTTRSVARPFCDSWACCTLQFDHVYFTDVIIFTVRLLVIPAPSATSDAELTLVTMETLSSIIWRVGHVNASGTVFDTQLTSCNFTAQPRTGVVGQTLLFTVISYDVAQI